MTTRFVALLVLAVACSAQQQPGSVSGSVTGISGEPLRKAQVFLRSVPTKDGLVMVADTDAAGTFTFSPISPGKYLVSAKRMAYLPADSKQITVAPGQHLAGTLIKLIPQAVISGKITDEDGDPLIGANVHVVQESFTRGRRTVHALASVAANDLGHYRLPGLQAGRYTILVMPPSAEFGPALLRARAPGQESTVTFVPFYFPGVKESSEATPILLGPGQDLRGIDVRMRKILVVNVRGRVLDLSGNPVASANVSITSTDNGSAPLFGNNITSPRADGMFVLPGIPAGTYVVRVNMIAREARASGTSTVQVGSRDVDDVIVRMTPPGRVSGRIKADGSPDLSKARVVLDATDTFASGMHSSDDIGEGGAFQIADVPQTRYRVRVFAAPEGYYVKLVLWNGEDITDKGLTVTSAASGVEITIAKGATNIRGALVGGDGIKIPGGSVTLVPPATRRDHWDLYQNVVVDQNGDFTMRNIPPGEYVLFGFGPESKPSTLQNPEYLNQIASKGKTIKVSPDQAESVDVKVFE